MRHRLSFIMPSPAMAVAVAGLIAACSGIAVAASSSNPVIRACANKKTGALRLASKCRHSERSVSWSQKGLEGPRGLTGATGATGGTGATGPQGPSKLSAVTEVLGPEVFVEPGKFNSSVAKCPKGTRAISGGSMVEAEQATPDIVISRAVAGRTAWALEVGSTITNKEDIAVTAIAYCAGEGEAVAG